LVLALALDGVVVLEIPMFLIISMVGEVFITTPVIGLGIQMVPLILLLPILIMVREPLVPERPLPEQLLLPNLEVVAYLLFVR
jgi:hypothetical protein